MSPNPLNGYLKTLFSGAFSDGASRDRTGDLLLAKQALSHLSYGPVPSSVERGTATDRLKAKLVFKGANSPPPP
jgi:hypothetical protein